MSLQTLADDLADKEALSAERRTECLKQLNVLDRHELAKLVIIIGKLDADIVTSYHNLPQGNMDWKVLEALQVTLAYIDDVRLILLVLDSFDEHMVRVQPMRSLLGGMRAHSIIPKRGSLTYRTKVMTLLWAIIINEVFDILGIPDDEIPDDDEASLDEIV